MKKILLLPVAYIAIAGTSLIAAAASASTPALGKNTGKDDAIIIDGIREWPSTNPADKLYMAAGVTTTTVVRSNREQPADPRAEGRGWTWQHHPDMAAWRGRLYLGWDSGLKDEDQWPARQLYSTTADGKNWTRPQELFPQGTSIPLRTYFFRAPNDTMLAIAGLRIGYKRVFERTKEGVVVRRINADHTLGPVYTLRLPASWISGKTKPFELVANLPAFDKSPDAQFVEACRQLLASHTFLMQQDFGRLMDKNDRMSWCQSTNWGESDYDEKARGVFGRAFSFYHRKDGAIVGIAKERWTTVSHDEGKTWSKPVKPTTLITANAKVWGAHTADGRYALVYNPHLSDRWPLVVVSGDDGIHFKDMAVVHAGIDPLRYEGGNKDLGAQYVRGISEWATDGSWKDNALWVAYSINKEDILVSRIPLPIRIDRKNGPVDATRPATQAPAEQAPIAPPAVTK